MLLLLVCIVQLKVQAQVPTQEPYPNVVTSATNINSYGFFIDSVSTLNEQTLSFVAGSTNTSAGTTISLTGVSSGVHNLYVKVSTVDGTPSITNIGTFHMEGDNFYPNVPAAATPIDTYSFFVDSISTVNEQLLSFVAASTNTTAANAISLTGVSSGVHQLYAKVTTTGGLPSITNIGSFFMEGDNLYPNVPASATQINRYEFFIDSVTNTNIQSLAFPAASQNTSPGASIDLLGVLPGIHNLYARIYDVNNVPSITNVGQFAMDQNFRYADVAAPAPPLQNMEYYIDTDPGYGLATPISISVTNTTEVLTNISINIPATLTGGTHFFHIRSRQNPWSIDNALPFVVSVVLPVTWLYVKAQLLSSTTQIQWATANELNSKNFDVEWSTDGVTFIKIGSVNAAGNTNNTTTYNFTHGTPANGFNYYRLKQIDVDGRFKYSAVVKVLKQQTKQLLIYPNPATTYVQLDLSNNKTTLIQLFDAQGKQVITQYASNQSLLKVDITALAKGNYIIHVSDGEILQTGSFIKQ